MAITEIEALEIAWADAQSTYADLSGYQVAAQLENGNWVIVYALREGRGGGPQYIISGTNGTIIHKVYYQ